MDRSNIKATHTLEKPVLVIGTETACADFIKQYQKTTPEGVTLVDGAYEHGTTDPEQFVQAINQYPDDFKGYTGLIVVIDPADRCPADAIYKHYYGLPAIIVDPHCQEEPSVDSSVTFAEYCRSLSHIVLRTRRPVGISPYHFRDETEHMRTFTCEAQHRLCHALATNNWARCREIIADSIGDTAPSTETSLGMPTQRRALLEYLGRDRKLNYQEISELVGENPEDVRKVLIKAQIETNTDVVKRRPFLMGVTLTTALTDHLAGMVKSQVPGEAITRCIEDHTREDVHKSHEHASLSLIRDAVAYALFGSISGQKTYIARIFSSEVTPHDIGKTPPRKIMPVVNSCTRLREKFAQVSDAVGVTDQGEPIVTIDEINTIMAEKQFGWDVSVERMAARLRGIWVRFEDGKLPLQEGMDLRGSFMHFASQHLGKLCGKNDAQAQIWFEKRAAKAKGTAGAPTTGLAAYNTRSGCKFP